MKEIVTQKLTSRLIENQPALPSLTQPLDAMYYATKKRAIFKKRLSSLSSSNEIDFDTLKGNLSKTIEILLNEPSYIRPSAPHGKPGGLILLNTDIPTIIIPDLHGRRTFLMETLFYTGSSGISHLNLMLEGKLNIVCVGDGMHSEQRGQKRWLKALGEYKLKSKQTPALDEEMIESYSLMQMVMQLKISAPNHFHFLKGNHENVLSEEGNGNHPFAKFALESPMTREWTGSVFGKKFIQQYARFEKLLPILAVGKNFLVSHAEPKQYYPARQIVDYNHHPDVIEGLTWTENDMAETGSVEKMLAQFFPEYDISRLYYFGGHRQVNGKYSARANGRYIQVNHPHKMYFTYIHPEKLFHPDRDIVDMEEKEHYDE